MRSRTAAKVSGIDGSQGLTTVRVGEPVCTGFNGFSLGAGANGANVGTCTLSHSVTGRDSEVGLRELEAVFSTPVPPWGNWAAPGGNEPIWLTNGDSAGTSLPVEGTDRRPRAIPRSGHLERLVCSGLGSSQSAGAAVSSLKRTLKDTEARRLQKKGKSDCRTRPLRAALPLDQTVHPFRIGDQVLVKKWKRDPLTPRWDGPHTISLISQAAVKILGSDKWTHHTWVKRFLNPDQGTNPTDEDTGPLPTPAPEARGGTGEDTVWEYQGLDGLKGLFRKKQ
ncbi:uncharacterized protein LOC128847376 [Malaclemys terrapin pileata]|uniref:uncharacterized protein LOC128847376 n=1 Tax=Malaclemys terrapin pileata TaxID=2991368 RepID=UPI0023A832B7|nr:uncharacterized protein LOC128847376 [Malaclemys terrapin pileata]